jgi:oxygen-independent coproporphyrinogen-3 oxidase
MGSVYVHIPFCLSKCSYCGFNSIPLSDAATLESYCEALIAEVNAWSPAANQLATLYFGGGTPSILSRAQLRRIVDAIAAKAALAPGAELTIEANPETLDATKLSALRGAGCNRLSIGVQSFDDGLLRLMGRPHDAAQAARAFEDARRAGFDNIGVDLIFALPGQTLRQWQRDLDAALKLSPEHVSLYGLAYEGNSGFARQRSRGTITPCDEDAETEMYLAAISDMTAAGYAHYEVSNFARPGRESRHNLNYWRCGDYRGFGAGAHSHVAGRRWGNDADPLAYIGRINAGASPVTFEEQLGRAQRMYEAIFLGLRLVRGIALADFQRQWGASPLAYLPQVWDSLQQQGLADISDSNVTLTGKGLLLADSVLARLAPERIQC